MPGLKTRQRFWEAAGRQTGNGGTRRHCKKGEKGKERAECFAGAAAGRVHAPDKLMVKRSREGITIPLIPAMLQHSSALGEQLRKKDSALLTLQSPTVTVFGAKVQGTPCTHHSSVGRGAVPGCCLDIEVSFFECSLRIPSFLRASLEETEDAAIKMLTLSGIG